MFHSWGSLHPSGCSSRSGKQGPDPVGAVVVPHMSWTSVQLLLVSTWLGPVPVPAPWTTTQPRPMASPEARTEQPILQKEQLRFGHPAISTAAAVQQLHWALEQQIAALQVLSLPESRGFCKYLVSFYIEFYDSVCHDVFCGYFLIEVLKIIMFC